jgi:hypothetical protein
MKTNKPTFSPEPKYITQWLDVKKDTNISYADTTRTTKEKVKIFVLLAMTATGHIFFSSQLTSNH